MQAIKLALGSTRRFVANKDERDQQCERQQEGEEDPHPLSMGLFALDGYHKHAPARTAGFLL
jgi:hypothetical protein